ncbi:peptidoglycan-binding domain-containing protein [Streptomyces sp. T-3]|nr:peptidoglycan-binding domain-containing protein [Streptomyces sp. T-3]
MNFRTTRGRLATAAVGAAVAGALAVSATPASAASGDGYVSGGGQFKDDFGDEGTLSTTSYSSSNATALWQTILWADGAIESNGSVFDGSDIDGHFGANTKAATKNLQGRWDLSKDGIVGRATFGGADSTGKLVHIGTSTSEKFRFKLRYNGTEHDFNLYRSSNGRINDQRVSGRSAASP